MDAIKAAASHSLRTNRWPLMIMTAHAAVVVTFSYLFGFMISIRIYPPIWLFIVITSFTMILIVVISRALIVHRPKKPFSFIHTRMANDWRLRERAIVALPFVVVFPIFFSLYTSAKTAYAQINPFYLDPMLAGIDKSIHGGHAWELIHPLVGFPMVTFFLSIVYAAWLYLFFVVVAFVAVTVERPALRNQFLITFLLSWALLGGAAAIALSSVGPCFYERLYPGDTTYEPLMAYLRSVHETYPLWIIPAQNYVWTNVTNGTPGIGKGISAMPSLHVAITVLMAILAWRLSKLLGLVAAVFAALILVGSVHLGFHYAVDGYASLLAVPLLWKFSGWLVRDEETATMPSLIAPAVASASPSSGSR